MSIAHREALTKGGPVVDLLSWIYEIELYGEAMYALMLEHGGELTADQRRKVEACRLLEIQMTEFLGTHRQPAGRRRAGSPASIPGLKRRASGPAGVLHLDVDQFDLELQDAAGRNLTGGVVAIAEVGRHIELPRVAGPHELQGFGPPGD